MNNGTALLVGGILGRTLPGWCESVLPWHQCLLGAGKRTQLTTWNLRSTPC